MVPIALTNAAKRFRETIFRQPTVHVEADADADGIASCVLLLRALEKHKINASGEAILREEVHPVDVPLCFADLALCGRALDVIKQNGTVLAVDHHRWDPLALRYVSAPLNPHLLGMENAHRWNTGALIYITFPNELVDYTWLAAASSEADHTYEDMRAVLNVEVPYEKVKEAAERLGAPAYHPDFSPTDAVKRLLSISTLDEFLDDTFFHRAHLDVSAEISRYVAHPPETALVFDKRNNILVVLVKSRFPRIKSPISTILSDKYPDWIVCVMQKYNNELHVSLRCQNYKNRGLDMGKVAAQIGTELMGVGGGHPPAAGITLPSGTLPDDVINALYRATSGKA